MRIGVVLCCKGRNWKFDELPTLSWKDANLCEELMQAEASLNIATRLTFN